MGDRFYLAQIAYHKTLNRALRAAGTKATIIEKIVSLDPDFTVSKLKPLLKQPLIDILMGLTKLEENMTTWTQELKDEVIKSYTDESPTAETSMEIIKQIAEDTGVTPNGIRMVLVQAGVYVKKEASSGSSSTKAASGEGTKRVSKESQLSALKVALGNAGAPVDEELIEKMTGKLAAYILEVVKAVSKS
jgi:hypothetical protein